MWSLSGEPQSDNLEDIRQKRLLEMKDRLYAFGKLSLSFYCNFLVSNAKFYLVLLGVVFVVYIFNEI